MENGAKYEVNTYWGWFRLDEGAYRDYLAGRLWICRTPGGRRTPAPAETLPADVSDEAKRLCERAGREGAAAVLASLCGGDGFRVPCRGETAALSIDELNLSVRSSNGLRRAGIHDLGTLCARIESPLGLSSIRNLGVKSVKEITTAMVSECYARLRPYEKLRYWQDVLDEREKDAPGGRE